MKRFRPLVLLISAVIVLSPPVVNLSRTVTASDPHRHPRYDGIRYVVSDDNQLPAQTDSSGLAAIIATLLHWNGDTFSEADIDERRTAGGLPTSEDGFQRLLGLYGLEGHWIDADTSTLHALETPFLVSMTEDGVAGWLIVRRVFSGHVFGTEPLVGSVQYPIDSFRAHWTGRAFAFIDPPRPSEYWH